MAFGCGRHIRMVMAALERLRSHLLWAGVASELIGFETLFMQIFRLRESVMDALESISGNRVNFSMNRIGGVNRDLRDDAKVREVIHGIRAVTEGTLISLLTTDQTVIARCQGVGVLTRQDAIAYGVVGPVARASGLDTDLRRDQPYLAYDKVEFAMPVQTAGDVLARVVVRALEIVESCKIIDQVLDRMPQARFMPARFTLFRQAMPWCASRLRAARSSTTLLPTQRYAPSGQGAHSELCQHSIGGGQGDENTIADVRLIQAALDPCHSCTDR